MLLVVLQSRFAERAAVVAIGDNVARSSRCCKYSALAAQKKSAIECSQSAVANASIWWRFITFGREIVANVRVGGGQHGTARCSLRASRIEDEDEEEDKIEDSDWRWKTQRLSASWPSAATLAFENTSRPSSYGTTSS